MADPPFKRAETEIVSVEVKSVLPTSDRSYEVEWAETTRDLYGTVKRIVITVTLGSVWMLSARSQLPTQPPVGVKRVPQAAMGQIPPKNIPPLLQQYDFGGQVQTLEDSGSLPTAAKPEFVTPGATSGAVPKDFRPKADVPLTATALEAVRVSEHWQGEKNAPSFGSDGRVM